MRPNPSAPGGDPDTPPRGEALIQVVAVTLMAATASAALAGPIASVLVAIWERLT